MIILREKVFGKTSRLGEFIENLVSTTKKNKSPKPRKVKSKYKYQYQEEPPITVPTKLPKVETFNLEDFGHQSKHGYSSKYLDKSQEDYIESVRKESGNKAAKRAAKEGREYYTWPAEEIFDNYANAMTRKRSYLYYGLPHHLDNEPITALKDPDSLGMIIGKSHEGIFHPSHFAPKDIKNGIKLAEMSKESETPILYTVPKDLSDQLMKVGGHTRYGSMPNYFNGELMMKDLVGNSAFNNMDKEELIKKIVSNPEFEKYGITKEILKDLLKVSENERVVANRVYDGPTKLHLVNNRFKPGNPINKTSTNFRDAITKIEDFKTK